MTAPLCADCGERKVVARGLCGRDYQRRKKSGDLPTSWPTPPPQARRRFPPRDELFDAKWVLDPLTGCHIWIASRNAAPHDYGRFHVGDGRPMIAAHIYAYERKYGPIPDGLELDHFKCDTPACVNPDHARPVTRRENCLRSDNVGARNAAKTQCPRGHPYDAQWSSGARVCNRCRRDRAASLRSSGVGSPI